MNKEQTRTTYYILLSIVVFYFAVMILEGLLAK